MQGLKGDCSVSELCNNHGITQRVYYKWRDQLLRDGAKLFERGGIDHVRERLEYENRKLKETITKLTGELRANFKSIGFSLLITRSLMRQNHFDASSVTFFQKVVKNLNFKRSPPCPSLRDLLLPSVLAKLKCF